MTDATEVKPIEPHDYVPSAMHMGDCAICGHVQDSPIHRAAARPEPRLPYHPAWICRCTDRECTGWRQAKSLGGGHVTFDQATKLLGEAYDERH